MERCKDSFSWKVSSSTIVSMLRGTKRCDSFFAQGGGGGRGGESIYVLYTRLCPGNIEPRPFYRAELSSPPWYLFNTDATPRQPLLSYRPTCNTCPRGVSLPPRFSRQWKDIPVEIIIFDSLLSFFLASRMKIVVYHFSRFRDISRNHSGTVFAKIVHGTRLKRGGLIQYRGGISSSDPPAKIIEVANKLDEFHVKRWNSGGGLSMHE